MAYGGTGILPGSVYSNMGIMGYSGTRFNDQATADEFSKTYKAAGSPKFQAGQYFTAEDGTKYRTVAGIDPNVAGWGDLVDPDYELIGYQAPEMYTGKQLEFYGNKPKTEGIAFLRERKKEEPIVEKPKVEEPEVEKPEVEKPEVDTGGDTGPSETDLAIQGLLDKIAGLQDDLTTGLGSQEDYFKGIINDQNQRYADLQNMMIAQQQQRDRPTVMGVRTATGSGGNPMQIARRGVSGSFGRRGMRISSLNV